MYRFSKPRVEIPSKSLSLLLPGNKLALDTAASTLNAGRISTINLASDFLLIAPLARLTKKFTKLGSSYKRWVATYQWISFSSHCLVGSLRFPDGRMIVLGAPGRGPAAVRRTLHT